MSESAGKTGLFYPYAYGWQQSAINMARRRLGHALNSKTPEGRVEWILDALNVLQDADEVAIYKAWQEGETRCMTK